MTNPFAFWTRAGPMLSNTMRGWLEDPADGPRAVQRYEALFIIVDSMFTSTPKAEVTAQLPWRQKIASLNYLLAPCLQQITTASRTKIRLSDHVINKKGRHRARVPPTDANCLLSVFDHCLRSRHYVNLWPESTQCQWLTWRRSRIAPRASVSGNGSNDQDAEPRGKPLRERLLGDPSCRFHPCAHLPELKSECQCFDLMRLQSASEAPARLNDTDYDSLFTKDSHHLGFMDTLVIHR